MDTDPDSSGYGRLVEQVDMPQAGDELHHFGWNACSSCLCPYSPHPHMERRYLVVPGIRSSRIHIIDTKPDPRRPKIVKVIEPGEVIEWTDYAAPHHSLRSRRHLPERVGRTRGRGPGGIFIMDPETFDLVALGTRSWPATPGLRLWWHLGYDTMVTS